MTNALALIVLGFFLGMRHATDPDHVIAVSTIVARERSTAGAAAIGAVWGLGHTLTILFVGGGIILFGWVIPPRIGLSMEFSVGLMLIVLGMVNLAGVLRTGNHAHAHPQLVWLDQRFGALVHGLAGSAAVALLVLTTIRDPAWAIWYLLVFGLGTILGMALMTMAIISPFRRTGVSAERLGGRLRLASGALSLAFGVFVAYRIGVVDGLFTAHPHWTPE
jgi:high-affinity nickel-transport protein